MAYSNVNSNSRQNKSPASPLNKNAMTEGNDSSSKKFGKKTIDLKVIQVLSLLLQVAQNCKKIFNQF